MTTKLLACLSLLLASPPSARGGLFSSGSAEGDHINSGGDGEPSADHIHSAAQSGQEVNLFGQPTYGVDVSFPIHHNYMSDNFAWLPHNLDPENNPTPKEFEGKPVQYMGDKQGEYDAFLEGCDKHYNQKDKKYSECRVTEQDRVEMSLRQPASMQNYTELGFKKIRAPKEVWERVKKFWEENKGRENWKNENWPKGNTYTNHVSLVGRMHGGRQVAIL